MSGLAGVASSDSWDPSSMLKTMAESLAINPHNHSDRWNNSLAGFVRVRCGFDNPEPQPIFSHDKSKCIIWVGECFGYETKKQELLSRGYTFNHNNNDAEFCLQLYEEYGEKAFTMLSGSYCFAIYNLTTGEILLVNDRLGSRPLFYAWTSDGRLIFSTQVSSILHSPDVSRAIDTAAVIEFCSLQRVLGSKTYHESVKMLPPASVLCYRNGKASITAYWQLDYKPQPGSIDDYAEELAATLRNSARHITRDNARVAMLLSGGLDARMIVAAVDGKLVCYTFGDYENPEAGVARRIAESRGFEYRFLQRNPDHYVDMIDKAVELGNGMHAFNHAHALGFIEGIAQECDVVTHGFVPELLFRGGSYLPMIPRDFLGMKLGKRLDPELTANTLPQRLYQRGYALFNKGMSELFTPELKANLNEVLLISAQKVLNRAAAHCSNVYDQYLWPDVYHYARYPSFLFELCLRPYMTERSIVFHNDVIDLHLRMPVEVRTDNRVWMKALKRLNGELAHVTDANTGHSPLMPAPIVSGIEAGKELIGQLPLLWRLNRNEVQRAGQFARQGLSPHSWSRFDWMVRNNKRFQSIIADTLHDPQALPPEIFDLKQINKVLTDHLANRGHHRHILFALLTFGRWHRKYGLCSPP